MRYAFVAEHRQQFSVRTMCRCLGAVWIAGVLWSYHSTQAQIEKVLDSRLMESARMVSSMIGERPTTFAASGSQSSIFQEGEGYSRQLTCQIWTLEGDLVSSSDNAPPEALAGSTEGFVEREINGELWRSYTLINHDAGIRVTVGDKVDFRNKLIADVIKGLLLPLLLIMLVIGGLIWWSVSKGLKPLKKWPTPCLVGTRRTCNLCMPRPYPPNLCRP